MFFERTEVLFVKPLEPFPKGFRGNAEVSGCFQGVLPMRSVPDDPFKALTRKLSKNKSFGDLAPMSVRVKGKSEALQRSAIILKEHRRWETKVIPSVYPKPTGVTDVSHLVQPGSRTLTIFNNYQFFFLRASSFFAWGKKIQKKAAPKWLKSKFHYPGKGCHNNLISSS